MTLPEILDALPRLVGEVSVEDLPALGGRVREVELLIEMRLRQPQGQAPAERWITAAQAATLAAVGVRSIYEWSLGKSWAARPTRRCVRINEAGFRRWLASRA